MSGAPSRGGGARDDRPAPVLLWDGTLVVPGVLSEEVAAALDLLEAFMRGTPPPSACRQVRLPRGVWSVREVARQAAVQFREQQAAHRANAAASAPAATVLTTAQAPSLSDRRQQLTTEQAATLAGVTEARIRQLAAAGVISGRKTSRNTWLLDPESVREFARRRGSRHGDDDGTGHRGPAGAGAA